MTFPGDPSVNPPPRSLLCIPIRCGMTTQHPQQQSSSSGGSVLGVISLINKESAASTSFTPNDERFADAFSVFCAMAVRNAREYERAVVAEARLSVAFDVMNYQV